MMHKTGCSGLLSWVCGLDVQMFDPPVCLIRACRLQKMNLTKDSAAAVIKEQKKVHTHTLCFDSLYISFQFLHFYLPSTILHSACSRCLSQRCLLLLLSNI